MAETLFKNVRIFDGEAKRPYVGEVMLQGNLIKKVAKGKGKIRANGATVVDGAGRDADARPDRAPRPRLLRGFRQPAGNRGRCSRRSTWCSRSTMRAP